MTNTAKLKGRIAEKGYNISRLSGVTGISRPALRAKLNGTSHFRTDEIVSLCTALDIGKDNMCDYFFPDFVV